MRLKNTISRLLHLPCGHALLHPAAPDCCSWGGTVNARSARPRLAGDTVAVGIVLPPVPRLTNTLQEQDRRRERQCNLAPMRYGAR